MVYWKQIHISRNVNKRTFGLVRPAKILYAVWSEFSLGAFCTAKVP